jgi:hypothetical protein
MLTKFNVMWKIILNKRKNKKKSKLIKRLKILSKIILLLQSLKKKNLKYLIVKLKFHLNNV